jgi:MFS family permease
MIQALPKTVSSKAHVFSALDDAPMTFAHYLYWLLASGGTLLDGFSVVSLGIALPLLKRDFAIAPAMLGFIGSALVLGAVLGAAVGGMAADRIGRKRAFLVDMAIIAAGSALCVIAPNPWLILAGQFVLGIGIGIDFPTSGSYVSEITPKASRSRMTVATIALQSVGMVAAALVGIAVLRVHPAVTDWRILLGAGGILAVLYIIARLGLPESPRWLAEKGRIAEAAAVLSALTGVPVSAARMETAAETGAFSAASANDKTSTLRTLFSQRYRTRTLLVSLPWLMMDVATHARHTRRPALRIRRRRHGGGRVRRRGRQRIDRSISVGRLHCGHLGRATFRPDPDAGRRLCRYGDRHAVADARGIGRRWARCPSLARHRGLRNVQFRDERGTERDDIHAGADPVPDRHTRIGQRLCGCERESRRDLRHVFSSPNSSGLGTGRRPDLDGGRERRRLGRDCGVLARDAQGRRNRGVVERTR